MRVLEFDIKGLTESDVEQIKQSHRHNSPAHGGYALLVVIAAAIWLVSRLPTVNFEPTTLYLGAATLNSDVSKSVRLQNTGANPVRVQQIAMEPEGSFHVSRDNCSGITISPGSSCALQILFRPSRTGEQQASVLAHIEGVNPSPAISLSGSAIGRPGGPSKLLVLDRSVAAFGQVTLGSTASLEIRGTNSGNAPIHITRVAANDRRFTVSERCSQQALAVGQSCVISVSFRPVSIESVVAELKIEDDTAEALHVVSLSGGSAEASVAVAVVEPAAIQFDPVPVGRETAPRTIRLFNQGQATLGVGSLALPNSAFRILRDDCSQRQVRPAGSCEILVAFAPTLEGTSEVSLSLQSDAPTGAISVALTGVATPIQRGRLSLSTHEVEFADVEIPTSARRHVLISNTGNGTLEGLRISLDATTSEFASDSGECASKIAPGSSCEVVLGFFPATEGAKTARLIVSATTDESPQFVAIHGNAIQAPVSLRVNPETLDFGEQQLGASGSASRVMLQNPSRRKIALARLSTGNPEFRIEQSTTCRSELEPSARCEVALIFTPRRIGPRRGELLIRTDSVPTLYRITLSGIGLRVPGVASPPSADGPVDNPGNTTSPPLPQVGCWRLGAKALEYSLLSKTSSYSGRVRITGIVENIGAAPNGPYPAMIQLGTASVVLATGRVSNVPAGGRTAITYDVDFSAATEFPPTYWLSVQFVQIGKAILKAPTTSECTVNPARIERSGAEMRELFKPRTNGIDKIKQIPAVKQLPKSPTNIH